MKMKDSKGTNDVDILAPDLGLSARLKMDVHDIECDWWLLLIWRYILGRTSKLG